MRLAKFFINGVSQQILCEQDKKLLDVIRNDLHLTGTKRACGQGHCGACSVIIDGKVVRSCTVSIEDIPDDARITTIEGIGGLYNPHPIQKAFTYEGAIQCGFCTPGMIVVAKALLDENPNPSEAEIRQAFKGNLCRCTGYNSIIRAVQLAGKLLSSEVKEDDIKVDTSKGTFGKRVPRPSSLAKATGTTRFGDDIPLPSNTLHLKIVYVPYHHARIKSVITTEAEKMPGVMGVLTAKDIPGFNRIAHRLPGYYKNYIPTEPILCDNKVTHWGCAAAIVVAETAEQAEAAKDKVIVECEVLPRYITPKESLTKEAVPIVPELKSNLVYTGCLQKSGLDQKEAEKALDEAEVVVEGKFVTSRRPHLLLEPDSALAFVDDYDRLTIMSRSIAIHSHISQLSAALGIDPQKIRWIESPSGGSFCYKTVITCEGFAALAALKYRRPCKIVYDMRETILTTGKDAKVWVNKARLGATKDGYLKALVYDMDVDCGGFDGVSGLFLGKCHKFIGGPYNIPHIYGEGRIVLTNNNRFIPSRGFGGHQMALISESLIDMMAVKLGIDPLEFRYRNAWKEGDIANWGTKLDCYPYPAMLDKLRPLYQTTKEKAKKESTSEKKLGVGIGAGFWEGERDDKDTSTAWVELNPDNGFTVYTTWADPGQGADLGAISVASKALGGIPPDKIHVVTRDSSLTPDGGPSAGSRQTATTGNAIRFACESLLKAMKDNNCHNYADMLAKKVPLRYVGVYKWESPFPTNENYQGMPYRNLSYNLQMAEVEVEISTGKTNVLKMTSITDAGTIHNPLIVEGQAEGGMNMGAGFALWEDFIPGETDTLVKGGIPNFRNSPETEFYFNETFRTHGTYGGIGLGETVMFGAAPAIMNAIYDACGVRIFEVPARPEVVLKALKNKDRT